MGITVGRWSVPSYSVHSYTLSPHRPYIRAVVHCFVLIHGDSYNYYRLETTSEAIPFNYFTLYGVSKSLYILQAKFLSSVYLVVIWQLRKWTLFFSQLLWISKVISQYQIVRFLAIETIASTFCVFLFIQFWLLITEAYYVKVPGDAKEWFMRCK